MEYKESKRVRERVDGKERKRGQLCCVFVIVCLRRIRGREEAGEQKRNRRESEGID